MYTQELGVRLIIDLNQIGVEIHICGEFVTVRAGPAVMTSIGPRSDWHTSYEHPPSHPLCRASDGARQARRMYCLPYRSWEYTAGLRFLSSTLIVPDKFTEPVLSETQQLIRPKEDLPRSPHGCGQ